jgi:hypothetical protein
VIGTVLWCLILAAGLTWEVTCRTGRHRRPGLGATVAALSVSLPGRIGLFVVWAFVGVHLFTRYTVPNGWV